MNDELKPIKYSLTRKLLISFLIICTVLGILIISLVSKYSRKYILGIYSRITISCAVNAAYTLHNAPIDKYLKGEEKELYNAHFKAIQNIASAYKLKYIYVYVPNVKTKEETVIMGVEGATGKPIKNYNLGDVPKSLVLPEKLENLYVNNTNPVTLEINNEYGHVISGYTVITDDNSKPIAIVGADIDFGHVQQRLMTDISFMFILVLSVLLLIYFIIIFYIKNTFINPILQLSEDMQVFTETGTIRIHSLLEQHDDEFNVISGLYNVMAVEKKRIENELHIAQAIQSSSLPSIFPAYPDHREFDIYANMVTAKEVGGDFYDFFFVDNDNFVFLIADVSGKGIPAALFMMETKSLLKNILKAGVAVDEAMTIVNKRLCKNNKQGFFVTVYLAMINLKTGKIKFVNAGHNPPLLKRIDRFNYYKVKANLVVGAMENVQYVAYEDTLTPGEEIFFYTDGVTEAMNNLKQLYGENRLQEVLNNNINIDPQDMIALVKEDIKKYIQDEEQSDDVTILIFRYNGSADKE